VSSSESLAANLDTDETERIAKEFERRANEF